MVSVLASSVVDCGFGHGSGQIRDHTFGISAKHAALRRESREWLARNQDNVSELIDMSIRGIIAELALNNYHSLMLNKWVIIYIGKSKDRQHNGKKEKGQTTIYKTLRKKTF